MPSFPESVNHGAPWTPTQEDILRYLTKQGKTQPYIAVRLGRTIGAIDARQAHLGIGPYEYDLKGYLCPVDKMGAPESVSDSQVRMSHLLTLLQDDYTTIRVRFKETAKLYTYKVPKSMVLEVGDMVVVPTRDEFSLATVHRIDDEPDIDVTRPYEIKWVVQRVDMADWKRQQEIEAVALERLKSNQRKAAREAALKTLLGDSSIEEIKQLLKGN